ncbi:hypothetical protein CFB84_20955 [Burkholderia aenigmatica]|uniref:Uncharacterized protein n=1 Tax=Burkholderia aenigmatica TaxID=2015348 RepID=A0A228IH63_9BURK|nr:hypothetical protein CFB84_20955 [Burkholderia aenigmatica]
MMLPASPRKSGRILRGKGKGLGVVTFPRGVISDLGACLDCRRKRAGLVRVSIASVIAHTTDALLLMKSLIKRGR